MQLLLDRLGGMVTESDLTLRREGRTVAATSLVAFSCAVVLAVTYAALGSWADAIVGAVSALGGLLLLVVWRRTRRTVTVVSFILGYYLVVFLGAALVTQALAYLGWVSVLPVVAFFVGGLRLGATWTVVSLVALAGTAAALLLVPLDAPVASAVVRLLRIASLPPTMAALGALFELSRSRSTQELEVARQLAEEANEARRRLLAKVSHEIRTPLNGVLGLTQALLLDELPDKTRHELQLIQRSGTGLLALINDLLDVARAEAGHLELHPGAVDLTRLVEDVASLHRRNAEVRGVELRVEAPATPVWVKTDEVRLRQVLGNLVSNGVKFTDAGFVAVTLTVGRMAGGLQEISLSVEDTGRGLPASAMERLFEPFTQFHPELAHQGTGLGLSIARELATRLGGQLSAASTPGRGSIFTLILVLERCEAPPPTSALKPLSQFTALVVDDNALNRRVARALVERLGGTVSEASNGREGVAAALAARPDLVLMDLQMPELDGLEATRELRARGYDGAIIAVTASAGPETSAQCSTAGMSGHLTKPLRLEALELEVSTCLSRQRSAA